MNTERNPANRINTHIDKTDWLWQQNSEERWNWLQYWWIVRCGWLCSEISGRTPRLFLAKLSHAELNRPEASCSGLEHLVRHTQTERDTEQTRHVSLCRILLSWLHWSRDYFWNGRMLRVCNSWVVPLVCICERWEQTLHTLCAGSWNALQLLL